jgi:hypothetical protein
MSPRPVTIWTAGDEARQPEPSSLDRIYPATSAAILNQFCEGGGVPNTGDTTGGSGDTPPGPPGGGDTGGGGVSFPTANLMGLYDADMGITTAVRPSSTADNYGWLQADAPYTSATAAADQSGHGNTLVMQGVSGGMRRAGIINGHAAIVGPGGGNGWPMLCANVAGLALTQMTVFAVMRPSFANTTYVGEFLFTLQPGMSAFECGSTGVQIGGRCVTPAAVVTAFPFGSGWTGQASNNTPFDIVIWRWDGVDVRGYKNGFALINPVPFTGPASITDFRSGNGQCEWSRWGFWGRGLTQVEMENVFITMGARYGIAVG